MTKQAEIKYGIIGILCKNFSDPIDINCPYCDAASEIINFLHEKGVEIKDYEEGEKESETVTDRHIEGQEASQNVQSGHSMQGRM